MTNYYYETFGDKDVIKEQKAELAEKRRLLSALEQDFVKLTDAGVIMIKLLTICDANINALDSLDYSLDLTEDFLFNTDVDLPIESTILAFDDYRKGAVKQISDINDDYYENIKGALDAIDDAKVRCANKVNETKSRIQWLEGWVG